MPQNKKEAKECDYYDDENKLCSEYSGTEYAYDMDEDNFDKEMPLKITKEWMSFVKWTEIKYLLHQISNIINAV